MRLRYWLMLPVVLLAIAAAAIGAKLYLAAPEPNGPITLFAPLDYRWDVERWWAAHPFNPQSPYYIPIGALPQPDGPVLNVRRDYNGDLQAAVDALPPGGGTLLLEPGTYSGDVDIIGRPNIHFVGQPTATLTGLVHVFSCPMAREYGTIANKVHRLDPEALACVREQPARNIYFKNLTFDGGGTRIGAFWAAAARGIVFDNVTFQNYRDPETPEANLAGGNAVIDDIWFRGVRFIGDSRFAIYLDGCHSCGVVESEIYPRFGSGGLLYLTNDDLTGDFNTDGKIGGHENRVARYIVIAHNKFGDSSSVGFYAPVVLRASDTLITMNTVYPYSYRFVMLEGNCDGTNANVHIGYENVRVIANRLAGVDHLLFLDGVQTGCGVLPGTTMTLGRYTVRDNVVGSLGEHGLVWVARGPISGPNQVERNCVGGLWLGSNRSCAAFAGLSEATPVASTPR